MIDNNNSFIKIKNKEEYTQVYIKKENIISFSNKIPTDILISKEFKNKLNINIINPKISYIIKITLKYIDKCLTFNISNSYVDTDNKLKFVSKVIKKYKCVDKNKSILSKLLENSVNINDIKNYLKLEYENLSFY